MSTGKVRVLNKEMIESAGKQPAVSSMLRYVKEDMMDLIEQVRGNQCMTIRIEIGTEASAKKVEKEVTNEKTKKGKKTNAKTSAKPADGNDKPDINDTDISGTETTESDGTAGDAETASGGETTTEGQALKDPLSETE